VKKTLILIVLVLSWGGAMAESEQAVIVHFTYGSTDLSRLFELERKLESAIEEAKVGEYDGNDVAVDGSNGYLYMYGANADALFEIVRPILEATEFMKGAKALLRYGPPADGIREVELVISP
jgi:hypothetical protein